MKIIDFIYKVIPNDLFRKFSKRYYKAIKRCSERRCCFCSQCYEQDECGFYTPKDAGAFARGSR